MKKISKIFSLALTIALAVPFSLMPLTASAVSEAKINICHATGSESNPWNIVEVSQNAWDEHSSGHSGHPSDYPYLGSFDPESQESAAENWCEENQPTATVVATKIVCDDEEDLPNWGEGDANIISTTASDFITDRQGRCHLQGGWDFQWAPSTPNPGDNNTSPAGSPWTTFGSTDIDGTVSTTVPAGALIWVREVLKDGYIEFSGDVEGSENPEDPESAEIYCHTDVLNYDNYDWIDPVEAGQTYYCVAFNVREEVPNTCMVPVSGGNTVTLGASPEKPLQEILNDAGYTINANTDQTTHEVWDGDGSNVTLEITKLDAIAGNASVFGYYINDGSSISFVPLIENGDHPDFVLPAYTGPITEVIPSAGLVSFAIDTYDGGVAKFYSTDPADNTHDGTNDHAAVYNPATDEYVVAFEDITFASADKDYNDMVVKIKTTCEEGLVCDPQINLIENGDFESPEVTTTQKWDIFDSGTSGLSWLVEWINPSEAPGVASLELHRGVNGWLSSAGSQQHAELDGDWVGPSSPGTGASTRIYQDIATIPGKNYELKFSFSPRPNTGEADNVLGVMWNNSDVSGTPVSAANTTNQTAWTEYTKLLAAVGSLTRLQFEDRGTQNSLGTFLDNVSLYCMEEEPCQPTSGNIVSDANTIVTYVDINGTVSDTDFPALEVTVVPQILTLAPDVWAADVGSTGAKWIWSNDPYDPDWKVNKWVTFTRQFNVEGTPGTGILNIATDNSYEVWVNKPTSDPADFADVSENNHSVADTHNVLSLLHEGSNTLSIRVKNWALPGSPKENNPGGLLYNLYWTTVCNGGNGDDPGTSRVHIVKYIDGSPATANTAKNQSFSIDVVGQWSGNLILDTGNSYESDIPHNYTNESNNIDIEEDTTSSNVVPFGGQCSNGKFRVVGYTVGDSLSEALNSGATTTDEVILNNIKNNAYVVVWNETCPDLSTVTMCKKDQLQSPLPDWTVMLLGSKVETVNVLPDGNNYSSGSLGAGSYVLVANGSYVYRPGNPTASTSDAAYSLRLPSDSVYGGPYIPWVRENNFPPPHTGWLGIQVNEAFTDWGSIFNPLHVYAHATTTYADGLFSLRILDDIYSDNSGSLNVDIYPGYAGLTGGDGCVTFNDVPFGTYNVDEILQNGWNNISGLGQVTVDDPTETFTIQNINNEGPIVCDRGFSPIGTQCIPNNTHIPRCSDGIDNDQDGQIDYPDDPGCESPGDEDETDSQPETIIQTSNTNNGGGGSSMYGSRHRDISGIFGGGGLVLGASTEDLMCEPYLKSYIKWGANNDPEEVKKLQIFLNQFFEVNNPVTGFYGPITFGMVKKFQSHQNDAVLAPWALAGLPTDGPTGYVYKTTKRWINILKCPEMVAYTPIPPLP